MADDVYPLPPPLLRRTRSILEHHLATSLPADLAFDLVLNELVVRAADATHASSAALALLRGNEMVCRRLREQCSGPGGSADTRDGLRSLRSHHMPSSAPMPKSILASIPMRCNGWGFAPCWLFRFDRKPIDDQKPFDQRPFDQRSSVKGRRSKTNG